MEERFTMGKAAQIIDVSTKTLKSWYKWYEDDTFEKPKGFKLPDYTVGNHGTKMFTIEQVQELQEAKIQLRTTYRGCMAEFNAIYNWGNRGTRILTVGKQYQKKKEKEKKENE